MLGLLNGAFGGMSALDYEERRVGLYNKEGVRISTVRVTDGSKPYETAVEHPLYDDHMIIVEAYTSKKAASTGHAKWVKRMTGKKLPKKLVECQNSAISKLLPKEIYFKKRELKNE